MLIHKNLGAYIHFPKGARKRVLLTLFDLVPRVCLLVISRFYSSEDATWPYNWVVIKQQNYKTKNKIRYDKIMKIILQNGLESALDPKKKAKTNRQTNKNNCGNLIGSICFQKS